MLDEEEDRPRVVEERVVVVVRETKTRLRTWEASARTQKGGGGCIEGVGSTVRGLLWA